MCSYDITWPNQKETQEIELFLQSVSAEKLPFDHSPNQEWNWYLNSSTIEDTDSDNDQLRPSAPPPPPRPHLSSSIANLHPAQSEELNNILVQIKCVSKFDELEIIRIMRLLRLCCIQLQIFVWCGISSVEDEERPPRLSSPVQLLHYCNWMNSASSN